MNHIGLKLADGSFYPVLEEGVSGRKRLVLTTVRDNQDTVQIDLYRGQGARANGAEFIGSLSVENIQFAPRSEPDVELIVSTDGEGGVEASAVDLPGGEKKHLSLQLGPPGVAAGQTPEPGPGETAAGLKRDSDEALLTGETYPIGPGDRRKEHLHRRRRRPLLLVAFVVLALILIAAVAFVVFRSLDGQRVPSLFGGAARGAEPGLDSGSGGQQAGSVSAAPQESAGEPLAEHPAASTEAATSEEAAQPEGASVGAAPAAASGSPAAPAEEQKKNIATASAGGVWYNIKRGDTLWDIAATYYRNPWLYPRIARANKIANPDLIFAGSKLFIPEL